MDFELPIGDAVSDIVDFMLDHFQVVFDAISAAIRFVSGNITDLLQATPVWAVFAVLAALGLWRVGWRFAVFVVASLLVVLGMDLWEQTMDTLGLVLSATLVALGIGLPSGVAMAKSDIVAAILRPVLDFMQTLPAFVYLIPAAMFFGLGEVPGTIATVIFSMPPAVRLMNLGVRQVPVENVEAGRAFGCNGAQLLFKVELPLAMPSIMAGVNQTIMLALSMATISAFIGAEGLGAIVTASLGDAQAGKGLLAGIAIALVAMMIDRILKGIRASFSRI